MATMNSDQPIIEAQIEEELRCLFCKKTAPALPPGSHRDHLGLRTLLPRRKNIQIETRYVTKSGTSQSYDLFWQ